MPNATDDVNRTFRQTLVVVGVLAGVALLWIAHDVFLLVFAGLLFGVFLDGVAEFIGKWSRLGRGWSMAMTLALLFSVTFVLISFVAPGVEAKLKEFEVMLPQSIAALRGQLMQYDWGRDIVQNFPSAQSIVGESSSMIQHFTGAVSTTFTIALRVVVVIVIGIYSAAEPARYRSGLLRLFAPEHHEKIRRVLFAIHERMWWWLIGVGGSMISLTILTLIGLAILGIPLAFTLALFTGLLTFIPNFGPIISAVPPILIGLMISPGKAVAVLVTYIIIQVLEAHLVTPLIQSRAIRMPPVLGLAAQLIFGLLFGFLGLILAAPIMAALLAVLQSISSERQNLAISK
ncbi:MAG TPA: AI-2E family transporter [Candidatus Kapabacteria bacterium]|jgi:predicted PurR-regulated permease PerM